MVAEQSEIVDYRSGKFMGKITKGLWSRDFWLIAAFPNRISPRKNLRNIVIDQ